MTDFCSVIMVHYPANAERVAMLKRTLDTLECGGYPYELLVAFHYPPEMPPCADDAFAFLVAKQRAGKITHLLINGANLWLHGGRNQLFKLADGAYITITDDDLEFSPGWLKDCIECLEKFPQFTLIATPLLIPARDSAHVVRAIVEGYRETARGGSNCMVMKRETLTAAGPFLAHWNSGGKFYDRTARLGCRIFALPENKAAHLAATKSQSINFSARVQPWIKTLATGETVNL